MRRAVAQQAVSPPRRGDAPANRRRGTPAARVLALQRTAGNRAVCTLLARQPRTTPADTEKRTSHVTMPGIGEIALTSFHWGGDTHDAGPGKAHIRDIHLTTPVGKHSAMLQKATAEGQHFKTVELVHYGASGTGIRITLTDCIIASYQLAGGARDVEQESWSLTFASAEHEAIR